MIEGGQGLARCLSKSIIQDLGWVLSGIDSIRRVFRMGWLLEVQQRAGKRRARTLLRIRPLSSMMMMPTSLTLCLTLKNTCERCIKAGLKFVGLRRCCESGRSVSYITVKLLKNCQAYRIRAPTASKR